MMWKDEIVEEVRAVREAYAARFDYDVARMFEDIRKKEQEHLDRLADLRPLKPRKANAIPPTNGSVG
jgi:rubrerythrin